MKTWFYWVQSDSFPFIFFCVLYRVVWMCLWKWFITVCLSLSFSPSCWLFCLCVWCVCVCSGLRQAAGGRWSLVSLKTRSLRSSLTALMVKEGTTTAMVIAALTLWALQRTSQSYNTQIIQTDFISTCIQSSFTENHDVSV